MSRWPAVVGAGLLLAACATPPRAPGLQLLERADEQLAASQYRRALALYDEMIRTYPEAPAAGRARASRAVLERLLLAQAEIERLRHEVELRQGELDRARREQDSREAEIERLKGDLDRVRRVDLLPAPAVR